MPLDPRVQRFLAMITAAGTADPARNIDERRNGFRTLMQGAGSARAAVPTRDIVVPGAVGPLPARLYDPVPGTAGPLPGLVFFHGGGLVSGDLDTHDPICSRLAEASRCRIVSVAYRLAPENPFPAAADDAWAAAAGIAAAADTFGLDPHRLALGGDSVGAGLAALVAQRARRHGGPVFAAQLLICPVLDASTAGASRQNFATGYFLERDTMARDFAMCGLDERDAADPRVSPLRAPDLIGLPAAVIHTAEFDPVRDDGEIFAARLEAAGVPVRLTRHPGMIHLFYGFGRLIPPGDAALGAIGAELRAVLTRDPAATLHVLRPDPSP